MDLFRIEVVMESSKVYKSIPLEIDEVEDLYDLNKDVFKRKSFRLPISNGIVILNPKKIESITIKEMKTAEFRF